MRRIITCCLVTMLVFTVCGCSFRPIYIVRNSLKESVIITLTIKGVKDSTGAWNQKIAAAPKTVPLRKSDLASAFTSEITGVWDKSGTCRFEVPAGWSADITQLLKRLNPERDASHSFNGSTLEIKYSNSALPLGNSLAEVQRIFKVKSFFWGGPVVYYLDLE